MVRFLKKERRQVAMGLAESLNYRENGQAVLQSLGNFSAMTKKSPRLRVLVVDDEPLIRWSLGETLEDSGHEVVSVGDRRSAIDAFSTLPPFDVVLLDLRLPDSSDLSLLALLRQLSPRTQIILMTAFGTAETFEDALELGAFSVVHKPFEVNALANLVIEAHGADTKS
jgi:DNA-binding NtrC family response regulator